jgi:8-oxo-dGTP diphosphatase
MLIEDHKGNQLLELMALSEAELCEVAPLTHALVVARRDGNENLLVFNRDRQYWELAGGLIDAGETPRDCAVRELREESGLVCEPASLRLVGAVKFLLQPSRFHREIHVEYGALYAVDIDQSLAFIANEEIANACWWDGSEAIGTISVIDQKLIELVALRRTRAPAEGE